MKRRILIVILVVAVGLLGWWVAGLVTSKPEPKAVESYADVSVGTLTVAIPADWPEEELGAEVAELPSVAGGACAIKLYSDKSGSASLGVTVWDMRRASEFGGVPWEEWQQIKEVEDAGRAFAIQQSSLAVAGIEDATMKDIRDLTIHGNEAWEMVYSGQLGRVPAKTNVVVIFGGEDLVTILMLAEETVWPVFEDCCTRVRDSARLSGATA